MGVLVKWHQHNLNFDEEEVVYYCTKCGTVVRPDEMLELYNDAQEEIEELKQEINNLAD